MQDVKPMVPDTRFMRAVEEGSGIKISACFQCKKCTNGCPTSFAMDIYPDQVIRLVQMGQREKVLNSSTIWVCSSCQTCSTRCPNEVDIAGTMDYLKEMAVREGISVPQSRTKAFHEAFLEDIRRRGRISEGGMMSMYMLKSGEIWDKLRSGDIKEDVVLAFEMLKRGRMPVLPKGIRAKDEVRKIIDG